MWEKPRPSILQRPLKAGTYNNRENLDAEWDKEQLKIQARRERYQQIDERLRIGNGGASGVDKHRLAEEDRQFSCQTMAARAQSGRQEKERERQAANLAMQRDEVLMMNEEEKRRRKREEERRVMEENIALAEAKKRRAAEDKQREQALERHNAAIMASAPRNFR